jgi:hypothetical protein
VKQQVISRTDYDPFAAARDMPVTRGRVTLPVGMRRSRGSNLQGIGNGEQGTGKRDLKLSKPPEPSKPSQPITNISNHGFDSNLSFMILCKQLIKKGCCPLYWIAVK